MLIRKHQADGPPSIPDVAQHVMRTEDVGTERADRAGAPRRPEQSDRHVRVPVTADGSASLPDTAQLAFQERGPDDRQQERGPIDGVVDLLRPVGAKGDSGHAPQDGLPPARTRAQAEPFAFCEPPGPDLRSAGPPTPGPGRSSHKPGVLAVQTCPAGRTSQTAVFRRRSNTTISPIPGSAPAMQTL